MSGARYPLQVVLELRERERDEAQEQLAARIAAIAAATALVETRQAEAAAAAAKVETALSAIDQPPADGSPLDVREMNRRRDEVVWLRGQAQQALQRVAAAEAALAAAHRAVDDARAYLVEKAQALAAIETHHEKWVAEARLEAERKEESLMQEVALSAWVRSSTEGTS